MSEQIGAGSLMAEQEPVAHSAQPGRRPVGARVSDLQPLHDEVLAAASELRSCVDAMDAEVWLTETLRLVGTWTTAPDGAPAVPLPAVLLDLVDAAEWAGTVDCLVLLRTLAVFSPAGCGPAAAAAAARVAARRRPSPEPAAQRPGSALPAWVDLLGSGVADGDYLFLDGFGEQLQVMSEFVQPGTERRHAYLLTVERSGRSRPLAIDLVVGGSQVRALRSALEQDSRRLGDRFVPIPPRHAVTLLSTALAAAAEPPSPLLRAVPVMDEASQAVLEMLIRRLAAASAATSSDVGRPDDALDRSLDELLGEGSARPGSQPWPAAVWPAARRAALVDRFLIERRAALSDVELASRIATLMIDLSLDVLRWPPDRLGPVSVTRLVGDVLPASVTLPDSRLEDLVRVVDEWLAWRLAELDLPQRSRGRVQLAVWDALSSLPRLCRDRSVNPRYPYVADLPARSATDQRLAAVIERRSYAVPLPGARTDGTVEMEVPGNGLPSGSTHIDDLDAGRQVQRQLITAIEHSRYLERSRHSGSTQRDSSARVGVVEQLWADEPVEVWAAATALAGTGLNRSQVLDRLAILWREYGPGEPEALERGEVPAGPGREGYLAALVALGTAAR